MESSRVAERYYPRGGHTFDKNEAVPVELGVEDDPTPDDDPCIVEEPTELNGPVVEDNGVVDDPELKEGAEELED
jgi:hypothetical protein